MSLSSCKLKGRGDDGIQFEDPPALWKHYQLPPFAPTPPNKSYVPGFTFNHSSSDFIIYQNWGRRGVRWGRGVGMTIQGWVSQASPVFISSSPHRVLSSPDGWCLGKWSGLLLLICMTAGHPVTVPGKRECESPSESQPLSQPPSLLTFLPWPSEVSWTANLPFRADADLTGFWWLFNLVRSKGRIVWKETKTNNFINRREKPNPQSQCVRTEIGQETRVCHLARTQMWLRIFLRIGWPQKT